MRFAFAANCTEILTFQVHSIDSQTQPRTGKKDLTQILVLDGWRLSTAWEHTYDTVCETGLSMLLLRKLVIRNSLEWLMRQGDQSVDNYVKHTCLKRQ